MPSLVEIYGIPADLHRCLGCESTIRVCDLNGVDWQLKPIVYKVDTPLGFDYNRPIIDELKTRAKMGKTPTNYPHIFVDGVYIGGYLKFKAHFEQLGMETEL